LYRSVFASFTTATLDMNGWLGLIHQGLSPWKKRQAFLGALTVRATWTNAGNTISAVVSFDNTGALVNFVSDDRSRTTDGKTYQQLRWSTPVSDWRDFDRRKLPVKGEAIWTLPGGEFAYGRFELLEAQYNVTDR
jgi:hypothetical protein